MTTTRSLPPRPATRAAGFARGATAAVTATALLSGCLVGPDFVRPEPPVVPQVAAFPLPAATDASGPAGQAGTAQRFVEGGVLPAQWWRSFGSPLLDGWVDEALARNPTLANAEATLRQQQELLRASRGGLFPSVGASAGVTRAKTNGSFAVGSTSGGTDTGSTDPGTGTGGTDGGTGTGGTGVSSGFATSGSIYNLYQASINVAYNLDLWGGTRRAIESQEALLAASRYQTSAAYLTLVGNVVTGAVAAASAQERLKTAQAIADSYVETVRLAERRYELGASARSDVITVQASLAQARADIPPIRQELAVARNRLASLLGRYPAEFESGDFDLNTFTLPVEVPVTLPAQLVQRRPDVAAASAQLHAAAASIGVAVANQLPQLVLSASGGIQDGESIFSFDDFIWSIGANLTAPLFDGGTLSARKRAAIAAYEASEASYRGVVIDAFRQVADSLAALQNDAAALVAQQEAFDLAKRSAELTELRYRTGTATVFDVRQARLQAAGAQQTLVLARAARFRDTAALFQALGGDGWNGYGPGAPPALALSNSLGTAVAGPRTGAAAVTTTNAGTGANAAR